LRANKSCLSVSTSSGRESFVLIARTWNHKTRVL
jgi:hypothetical protein